MRLPALLAGLSVVLAAPLAGQDTAARPAPAVATDTAPQGRPILLGADTVFVIHAAAPPYTLEQRALAVAANVQHAAALAARTDSVAVLPTTDGARLVLAGETLLDVLPGDVAAARVSAAELGRRWAAALDTVRARRAAAADSEHVVASVARALVATLVALLLLWLLFRLDTRVRAFLQERLEAGTRAFGPGGSRLLSRTQLLGGALAVARGLRFAGLLTLAYAWLVAVLGAFARTAPMADRVLRYVTTPLLGMLHAMVDYLPSLIFIGLVVFALRLLLRGLHFFFRAVEQGSIRLERFPAEWGDPTYKIVRTLVVAFGLILVFPYLPGSGSEAFNAISLFAGALFSLGSSGAVANIVAGSVITYTRAFKVGDFVRIGDTEGMVVERSLLVTRVRTATNIDVSIPSATVLGTHVMNYSAMAKQGGLVVQSRVTIGYDAPWRTVHELLLRAADATEGVLKAPAPFVVQESLSDYYPVYCLNVYTDRATGMDVFRLRSRLNEHIQDCFFAAGVEILSPAFTALRDGNRTAMPARYLPEDYENPGFKVVG